MPYEYLARCNCQNGDYYKNLLPTLEQINLEDFSEKTNLKTEQISFEKGDDLPF